MIILKILLGFLIICGVLALVGLYILYRVMFLQGIILSSAGRMKTGNDLDEQVAKTLKKNPRPNFFKFYWRLYKKLKSSWKEYYGEDSTEYHSQE